MTTWRAGYTAHWRNGETAYGFCISARRCHLAFDALIALCGVRSPNDEDDDVPLGNVIEPILTRCGYRCDLCLAYKPNVARNPSNQQKLSDGWFKYFGFRLLAPEICCDGCMADDPKLIDTSCPVRPCVVERGLDNCSQCGHYVCEKLAQRLVAYEEVKSRISAEIPEDDYLCFIKPYENKQRLDMLR